MASLIKRPESPYWIGCYTAGDGRQLKKSTKQRDKHKAWVMCLEWQRAENNAKEGTLTEIQARKVLSEILEKTTGESLSVVTVFDYLTEWIQSKEITKAEGTAKRYRRTVESFLSHLGGRSKLHLNSIRPRDIETFRDLQIKDGKSDGSANMEVKTLRVAFNVARRQGMIISNPAEAVELLDANSQTREPFTPDQMRKIYSSCPNEEWRGLVLVGRYCGLRITDASRLRWNNVESDGSNWVLRIYPQKRQRGKTRKILEIPMHRKLTDWIENIPTRNDAPDAPLFPTLCVKRAGGCNGLSAQFQKILKTAEIDCGLIKPRKEKEENNKGRSVKTLTFHSLRHTFVSRLANAGVSEEIRKKLAGHTSDAHERYTHHELKTLRNAIFRSKED